LIGVATVAAQNCSVTGFQYFGGCTKTCGGGTRWQARRVLVKPGPGGTPCPEINQTIPCNTDMCVATIGGRGFYYWGPLKGPGPITYNFRRGNEEFDVFLFDQANFLQYQFDSIRNPPYETGYTAVRSSLAVENSMETVALDANTLYYLVFDHTPVGAAQGTNQNGVQVYNPNTFAYVIKGLEVPEGQTNNPYRNWASNVTPATAIVVVLAAIAALFAL